MLKKKKEKTRIPFAYLTKAQYLGLENEQRHYYLERLYQYQKAEIKWIKKDLNVLRTSLKYYRKIGGKKWKKLQ